MDMSRSALESGRKGERMGANRDAACVTRIRWVPAAALVGCALWVGSGCVTPAEFEKVRIKVIKLERAEQTSGVLDERQRIADLAAEVERLEAEIGRLSGRVEVAEHLANEAVRESRAARTDVATAVVPIVDSDEEAALALEEGQQATPAEIAAYRTAYAARRQGDLEVCIDRFRDFLQTYPASAYADDAAFWMADCYFKNGDFKTAVLRFDDVVVRYPGGNKAADALYRQGDALLRLGPNYGKADGKAFERVRTEYPDSDRAADAQKQLDRLGSG